MSIINSSYLLQFEKIELYPFLGKYFSVEISLLNENGRSMKNINQTIDININLKVNSQNNYSVNSSSGITGLNNNPSSQNSNNSNSNEIYCNQLMEIRGIKRIEINGKCSIEIKINDLSCNHSNQPFQLITSFDSIIYQSNMKFYSSPIYIVKNHLILSNSTILPEIWYRDIPGKLHSIHLQIKLIAHNGEIVFGRIVPLIIRLKYSENNEVFPNQNVLRLLTRKNLLLNHGICDIYCCINEISKKHKNQTFSFYIEPDTQKNQTCGDISPLECGKIEVRSKPPDIRRSSRITHTRMKNASEQFEEYEGHSKKRKTRNSGSEQKNESSTESSQEIKTQSPTKLVTDPTITKLKSDQHHLIQWFNSVIQLLVKLKWNKIGSETVPYKSRSEITTSTSTSLSTLPNIPAEILISSPIYEMINPNQTIDQIIESYKQILDSKVSFPSTDCSQTEPNYSHLFSSPITSNPSSSTPPSALPPLPSVEELDMKMYQPFESPILQSTSISQSTSTSFTTPIHSNLSNEEARQLFLSFEEYFHQHQQHF